MDTEVLLTTDDLAARWQATKSSIYGLRYLGKCPPAVKLGRGLRFRLRDVEAWEQAHLEAEPEHRSAR
jgi:predicted DNA-binding transcriptional regulator AlpA